MKRWISGSMWTGAAIALAVIAGVSSVAARAATDRGLSVYWSDGDSGRLSDGTRFRLHGVDAPETGGVGGRGGAECEAERAIGYEAKAAAVALTGRDGVRVARDYGIDRYGRLVVDLEVNGRDVGAALVEAGALQDWDYDGGKPKPDWCGGRD